MRYLIYILVVILLSPYAYGAGDAHWHKQEEVAHRMLYYGYGSATSWGEVGLGTEELYLPPILQDAGQYAIAAMEVKLTGAWKTYWQNPGQGGLAFNIDVKEASNLGAITPIWPTPKRHLAFGEIENFVYEGRLLLPLIITPKEAGKPVSVSFDISFGVCLDVCLFVSSSHEIDTQKTSAAGIAQIDDIRHAWRNLPRINGAYGLRLDSAHLAGDVLTVRGRATLARDIDIIINGGDDFHFPAAHLSWEGDVFTAYVKYDSVVTGRTPDGRSASFVLRGAREAVSADVTLKEGRAVTFAHPEVNAISTPPPSSEEPGILLMLLFAFLGGLILNIMPCVLPVLSLKVMGLLKHDAGNSTHIRASFIASIAGIITSFVILAALVISMQIAGAAVGWGFHFQNPYFITTLIVVMMLFAANEWEILHINLPYFLGGAVQKSLEDERGAGRRGDFLTGMFATLMATPCSAPFLGSAVSFALLRGAGEIAAIFLMMGVGLAAPYIIFAAFPRLVRFMPRPGRWMLHVKHILGAMLVLTALWLLWVLMRQEGLIAAAIVLCIVTLMLLALLFMHKYRRKSTLLLAALMLAAIASPALMPKADTRQEEQEDGWEKFDIDALNRHVTSGRVVFVDVTAAWCTTCAWNKINVTNTQEMRKFFSQHDVVLMKADYTRPSKYITDFLKSHERYGIPFNVVYGKRAAAGIPLPVLLTKDSIKHAVMQAK